ncbi:MAG: class I SAM-dependent methyltransferase [Nanoarchaeota archaeon]
MKSIPSEHLILEKVKTPIDYILFLKHLFAYKFVAHTLTREDSVLEIGFGDGYGLNLIAPYGKKGIGVEVRDDLVSNATQKYGNPNCIFQKYDGLDIDFNDGSFDCVISFQVLEHIHDELRFLKEAKRVLKTGGKLYLSTPNRKYRLTKNQLPWNKFHVREYSSEELRLLIGTIFQHYSIYGVDAPLYIKSAEKFRVLRKKNYSGLFKRSSFVAIAFFGRIYLRLFNCFYHNNMKKRLSENLFSMEKGDLDDCLDLFIICQK